MADRPGWTRVNPESRCEEWRLYLSCGHVELHRVPSARMPGWYTDAYLWYGRPLGIAPGALTSTDLADAQREALEVIAARLREATAEVESVLADGSAKEGT